MPGGVAHPGAVISPRFLAGASARTVLQPAQLSFIAEVTSRLQHGTYQVENGPCPCGEANGVVISEVDRYGLPLTFVLCDACATVRIDPYLDRSSLEDFYTRFYQQMYARAADVDSYFSRQKSYGKKVLDVAEECLKPGNWIFEVGCGAGGALQVFQSRGYRVAGCDYSAELIAAGRQLGIPEIFHGTLKDIGANLNGVKADLIYLHHVFEHVNNPVDFLHEARKHLAPAGKIIIIVPDVSRIDSFVYPAGDLLQFLHIAHKYNFSFMGLTKLASHAGFQVRRLSPDPKMQTHTAHSPELWAELSVAQGVTDHETAPAQTQRSYGGEMLQYLKVTEKRYSMGLCRGQLLVKLNAGRNIIGSNLSRLRRVTPEKLIRKLKA